jgi:hypothetical protein
MFPLPGSWWADDDDARLHELEKVEEDDEMILR